MKILLIFTLEKAVTAEFRLQRVSGENHVILLILTKFNYFAFQVAKRFGSLDNYTYICFMETKICESCKLTKEFSEFHKNPRRKDGIQGMCKVCRKAYHRKHYLENKQSYIDKAAAHHKITTDKFKEFKSTLKCENCNEKRWWVLDFHHIDKSTKDFNIAQTRGYSWKKLMNEISKCKVLCANCHRDLHYQEQNASVG